MPTTPPPAIPEANAHAPASLPGDAVSEQSTFQRHCEMKPLQRPATRALQAKNRQVMALACSPAGVSITDLCALFKCSKEKARDVIASLRERKYITGQVKAWGATRYFDTPERAKQYRPPQPEASVLKLRTHWPLNLPGTPKPMHVPKAEAVAVVPDAVKRTMCPNWTHDPRYQLAPGEQPFGAGFAAVGIGRNVDTGRQWE